MLLEHCPCREGLTALVVSVLLALGPGFAHAGPKRPIAFSAEESARYGLMEESSPGALQARGGFFGDPTMQWVLIGALVVGAIVIAAANYDDDGPECIIDGQRIDPDSIECRQAKERADRERFYDDY